MAFTLIGSDDGNTSRITLKKGIHVIGRGDLLNIQNKRISREHAQLEVADDSLVLTALHQNPCFYMKKGSFEPQLLKQNCSANLNTGDKLGLLPFSSWFEVLHIMPSNDQDDNIHKCEEKSDPNVDPNEETDTEVESRLSEKDADEIVNVEGNMSIHDDATQLPFEYQKNHKANDKDLEKDMDNQNTSISTHSDHSSSTVLNMDLNNVNEPEPTSTTANLQDANSTISLPDQQALSDEHKNTPQKRSHDAEEECDIKKVKTEPEEKPDVKLDHNVNNINQPGSSNSNENDKAKSPPPAPLRERCMYGANCYRRNPQHLAQYSHPRDADWGTGPRAPCPRGAACNKRDPRHWRDHDHPPGKDQPPAQEGPLVLQRQGNIFYINAHTVNFYDDHLEMEDSDGNSVDYDYEF